MMECYGMEEEEEEEEEENVKFMSQRCGVSD
jgi:hypothetical protein